MFTAFCTAVGGEILLDAGAIESLFAVDGRLAMVYRCSCGERGLWRAGRGEPVPVPVDQYQ